MTAVLGIGAVTVKFEPDLSLGNRNRITAYGTGYVNVAGLRHTRNLIIMADRVIPGWGPTSAGEFLPEHMEALARLEPELVLVGTGARLVFPRHEIMTSLPLMGIGLEFMDTGAACRAYNFLLGEDRRVAAALIIA